jgi:hypothetical protein
MSSGFVNPSPVSKHRRHWLRAANVGGNWPLRLAERVFEAAFQVSARCSKRHCLVRTRNCAPVMLHHYFLLVISSQDRQRNDCRSPFRQAAGDKYRDRYLYLLAYQESSTWSAAVPLDLASTTRATNSFLTAWSRCLLLLPHPSLLCES